MRKYVTLVLLLILIFTLGNCNKEPKYVFVKIYDPFYCRGVAGSEISIIELHGDIPLNNFNCKTLKHITMDSNGEGFIEGVKFRSREKYAYILKLSKAYGSVAQGADICGIGLEDKEIPKTNGTASLQIIYVPPFQTGWAIKIVNLKSNATSSYANDSISVRVYHDFDYVEGWDNKYRSSQFNGSKSKAAELSIHLPSAQNRPDSIKYPESAYFPIMYGKLKVLVYKRKSGIVKDTIYNEIVRHDESIHEFLVRW